MKTRRRNYNNDKKEDRISDLPDGLILHILSSLKVKQTVQTSILSKRWKNLWKHLPTLTLTSSHFKTLKAFTKFVTPLLSLRNVPTSLHTLKFIYNGTIDPRLFEKILNYAVSHNVNELQLKGTCDIQQLPSCFFSCNTLTSLRFKVSPKTLSKRILFPNSLNLPSVTSLYLWLVSFRGGDDPFSGFTKLNSLMLSDFKILGEQNLSISSTTLDKLEIEMMFLFENYYKIELSTPNLNMCMNLEMDSPAILSWLMELTDIESLAISSTTLQVLSLVPDLLKVKLPSLCNLKSLRVKMKRISYSLFKEQLPTRSKEEFAKLKESFKKGSSSIPDGIVDFLLQNSPSAEVLIIN
ncbi:F-box/FBD/LRR-repeat protein At1g16930 [Medicago truncatula]|uniref:F-box/FBD/LRR-repeat protein At1g16930 n=1 Tax=Medicago truncatula TaxID=3880 RepID=UPI000D2F21A5|nr:F-box/FBD/LRR-repeat protein At1g16930 [Medicago truncatula]